MMEQKICSFLTLVTKHSPFQLSRSVDATLTPTYGTPSVVCGDYHSDIRHERAMK